jgi:phosphatidylcholine synthase
MTPRLRAAAVHVLTATGAAFALFALIAAAHARWHEMFVWLGIALIVDTVDGPLARYVGVSEVLPRWSGERLDLIVDYLTYIGVPAFALSQAEILPEPFRLPVAIAIMLASLFHMSDLESKTEDGYFVGFPAIWNVVLLYLFALSPPPAISLAIVVAFLVLIFVPLLAVHPFRVTALRPYALGLTVLWCLAAVAAVASPFPSPLWVQALLVASAAGLTALGFLRVFRAPRSK